jgi:hypothetical protein
MPSTLRAFPSWQTYSYIGSTVRVNGTTRHVRVQIAEGAEFAEPIWLCELCVLRGQF